jgi:hypothetical protein
MHTGIIPKFDFSWKFVIVIILGRKHGLELIAQLKMRRIELV